MAAKLELLRQAVRVGSLTDNGALCPVVIIAGVLVLKPSGGDAAALADLLRNELAATLVRYGTLPLPVAHLSRLAVQDSEHRELYFGRMYLCAGPVLAMESLARQLRDALTDYWRLAVAAEGGP
ncbi:MAG TPA: hypothetical protein VKA14_02460 [Gammaproteobacteria bacterium]|nr:hypothetical protein [Gammaproteobacteria bacterium]